MISVDLATYCYLFEFEQMSWPNLDEIDLPHGCPVKKVRTLGRD